MKKNENNVTCDTDVNVLSVRYYLMLKIPDEVKVDLPTLYFLVKTFNNVMS